MSNDSKGKKQILYPGLITMPPQNEALTLRDQFAMAAMQGDWATERMDSGYWSQDDIDAIFKDKAETYYRMADAMLKARGK